MQRPFTAHHATRSYRTYPPRLPLLALLLAALLAGGCGEVLNEYYLSNHTDQPLAVELTARYAAPIVASAGPLVEDLQTGMRTQLAEPLDVKRDGDTYAFSVPPRTSVFLGHSTGGNELFTEMIVSSDATELRMTDTDYRDHFAVHDRVVGAVVQVLNWR